MPTITLDTSDAAELADLLGCLRVGLDRLTSLLTRNDDEPVF